MTTPPRIHAELPHLPALQLLRHWQLTRRPGFAPVSEVLVERDIPVPMVDGTVLLTEHWAPTTPRPGAPVLLTRTPNGREGCAAEALAFAERGRHVVVQSSRGHFGSEGSFNPFFDEAADGLDCVAWIEAQPWEPSRGSDALPPTRAVERATGSDTAFFQDWLARGPDDAWWEPLDFVRAPSQVPPLVLVAGFYDLFGHAQVEDFVALQAAGRPFDSSLGRGRTSPPRSVPSPWLSRCASSPGSRRCMPSRPSASDRSGHGSGSASRRGRRPVTTSRCTHTRTGACDPRLPPDRRR